MIVDNWYVAAACAEMGDEPQTVQMFGCNFVLFRDADKQIACLSDVCCHRGGSLGHGKRLNGCSTKSKSMLQLVGPASSHDLRR